MQTVTSDALIDSLIAALADRPDDVPLRLHLAGLLLDADRPAEALPWISAVLVGTPAHPPALALLGRASNALIPRTDVPRPDLPSPDLPRPDHASPDLPSPDLPGPGVPNTDQLDT